MLLASELTLLQQAEPPPEPAGIKRSQSDRDIDSPDPNIKQEPDAKKPKLEKVAAQAQQPLKIIEIDPAGDLLILFTVDQTAYKVDSNAIKRAAPKFYDACLASRPSEGSSWIAKVPEASYEGYEAILHLTHANMENIPASMPCTNVHNSVHFARHFEFLGRFSGLLKQWYWAIRPDCHNGKKICNCIRLWMTYHLGLSQEFARLQAWAIFNLCDNGNGSLGDPAEQWNDKPLDLSKSNSCLAETVVTGKLLALISLTKGGKSNLICLERLIRLRSEAVKLIVTSLKEAQLAMIPCGQFAKDGRIKNRFGGRACSKCLDLWHGYLSRSLLRPDSINPVVRGEIPALSLMTDAKEYRQPLAKLCDFVDVVQGKMNGYFACTGKAQAACSPPQLVGRKAVEDLINRGLQAPLGAT